MSTIQDPGGTSTAGAAQPVAAGFPMPLAVRRIRRQLYWQAAFGLFRAALGLLVLVFVVTRLTALLVVVGGGVFVAGTALGVVSIVLARQVASRRRATRTVIVGLEAVVGVIYGLFTLNGLPALLAGGPLSAVAYNAVGLAIAIYVFRYAVGSDARAWFDAP
jgi:hypothetical protein